MRIRMTTHYIGPDAECLPGGLIDLPDDVASRYLASGQAELVEQASTRMEAATLAPSPNAMQRHQPQLKRRPNQ